MIPSRLHKLLTVTSQRKLSSTMRIFSSGVYFRRVAVFAVRANDLAASVRSSAAVALLVYVWDISTPLSEVIYFIQEADLAPNLSGSSIPSCVPISLTPHAGTLRTKFDNSFRIGRSAITTTYREYSYPVVRDLGQDTSSGIPKTPRPR